MLQKVNVRIELCDPCKVPNQVPRTEKLFNKCYLLVVFLTAENLYFSLRDAERTAKKIEASALYSGRQGQVLCRGVKRKRGSLNVQGRGPQGEHYHMDEGRPGVPWVGGSWGPREPKQHGGTDPGGYETTPHHPEMLGEGDNRQRQRASICYMPIKLYMNREIFHINTVWPIVQWLYKLMHLHHGQN